MRRYAVKAASKGYLGGDDRMGIQIYRDRFHDRDRPSPKAALEQLPADMQAERSARPSMPRCQHSAEYYSVVQAKLMTAATWQ